MPILANYTQFMGRHWETGSVANALAYQSEGALSEAMLLGISGGAAFGYFVFDYKGTDPLRPAEHLLIRIIWIRMTFVDFVESPW